jgi:DNA-binding NtrC family response regulator
VDDDPVVLGLMSLALGSLGFEVFQFDNGEAALALLESHPERQIHLLITDILMPKIGGNELASRLQSLQPRMLVLYCSGHPKEKVLQMECFGNESIRFLQKPFSSETFLVAVKEALG